ncbi:MAG: PKD domain-containing protein, partial [Beutenbergiaceae bacterium]
MVGTATRRGPRAVGALLLTLALAAAGTYAADSAQADDDSFTIVVLPDTQHYTADAELAPIFTAQTQWIAEQREELGIEFVLQLGDLVDSHPVTSQWQRADAAMAV